MLNVNFMLLRHKLCFKSLLLLHQVLTKALLFTRKTPSLKYRTKNSCKKEYQAATQLHKKVSHFNALLAFVVISLREHVSPMQQDLPHDGRHLEVVELLPPSGDLSDQVALPPPLRPGAVLPSFYLPLVVTSSSTEVKPAIPVKPSVRILFVDPARRLPHVQITSTFHFVLVNIVVVHRP